MCELPNEIWVHVMNKMDKPDLLWLWTNFRLVCNQFQAEIEHRFMDKWVPEHMEISVNGRMCFFHPFIISIHSLFVTSLYHFTV
jgi:hypothetical protein